MIAEASELRPAVFVVFDVLELDGKDVRHHLLFERRALLHRHVERCRSVQIIGTSKNTAKRYSARSQPTITRRKLNPTRHAVERSSICATECGVGF
jgi:ATP-dependent DNA ligase